MTAWYAVWTITAALRLSLRTELWARRMRSLAADATMDFPNHLAVRARRALVLRLARTAWCWRLNNRRTRCSASPMFISRRWAWAWIARPLVWHVSCATTTLSQSWVMRHFV